MNINCLFSARSSPVHINMPSAFRGWNARTYYIYYMAFAFKGALENDAEVVFETVSFGREFHSIIVLGKNE